MVLFKLRPLTILKAGVYAYISVFKRHTYMAHTSLFSLPTLWTLSFSFCKTWHGKKNEQTNKKYLAALQNDWVRRSLKASALYPHPHPLWIQKHKFHHHTPSYSCLGCWQERWSVLCQCVSSAKHLITFMEPRGDLWMQTQAKSGPIRTLNNGSAKNLFFSFIPCVPNYWLNYPNEYLPHWDYLSTSESHSEGYFSAKDAGGDGARCVVDVVGCIWRLVCSVANIPCRKTQFILSSVNIEQVSDQRE